LADAAWDAVLARARGELRDGVALTDLLRAAGADRRAALDRTSLVVLRPDCLASGRGAQVVEHLGELGATPAAVRVTTLSPASVDALYHQQPKIPRNHVWMHTLTMTGGPLAALLVTGDPGLTERLYLAKGPTSATADASPDSLRRLFGRASSTHAVVHVPEDTAALAAEATLFFSWDTVTGSREPLPAGVAEELVTLEPNPGLLVFQAVTQVKRRIAAALAARLPGSRTVAELRAVTAAADRALDGCDYAAQRDRLIEFAEAERPILDSLLAEVSGLVQAHEAPTRAGALRRLHEAVGPLELATASWFLSGHEPYGGDGGERLFDALDRNDVPLSPAQRLLLAAALTHDLHPGSRSGGQRVWPLGPDPGGSFG
jgi:nucleoside diphosphate kinase